MTEPMTESIARSIVQMLSANFGPWEEDRQRLWLTKVESLADGEAAWLAASLLIDGHEGARVRFAEFKTAYAGALRQLNERRSRERGLNQPERHSGIPQWYYVWKWLRYARDPQDLRTLPQERDPDTWDEEERRYIPDRPMRDAISEEEYETLREEWVAAGAPRVAAPGLP